MNSSPSAALILTYHGIDAGPAPLWVDPARFADQLDCLRAVGAHVLTVTELTAAFAARRLPERAVAITFDDGMSSVVDNAAPMLLERGMVATVYCVAGRLGGNNGWPTEPAHTPRRPLADAAALRELAAAGFEIGAHGMEHYPLHNADPALSRREIVDSRMQLEQQLGVAVTSFAYPYGLVAEGVGDALVRSTYAAACATRPAYARARDDAYRLPRVDIHYLRDPVRLARAVCGSASLYLGLRRAARRVRRLAIPDYAPALVD